MIVDNDPGDLDCRDLVEETGFRYVREDRRDSTTRALPGWRRRAATWSPSRTTTAFPRRTWLAALPELFADRSVGAVTGPGFAYELVTPPQVRFEEVDGFNRGLRARAYDLLMLDPVFARPARRRRQHGVPRDVLLALADPFPAELDAGTPTRSGGDLSALARALAAGYRVVYDPRRPRLPPAPP